MSLFTMHDWPKDTIFFWYFTFHVFIFYSPTNLLFLFLHQNFYKIAYFFWLDTNLIHIEGQQVSHKKIIIFHFHLLPYFFSNKKTIIMSMIHSMHIISYKDESFHMHNILSHSHNFSLFSPMSAFREIKVKKVSHFFIPTKKKNLPNFFILYTFCKKKRILAGRLFFVVHTL